MGVKIKKEDLHFNLTPDWWRASLRRTPELKAAVVAAIPAHPATVSITIGVNEISAHLILATDDDPAEFERWHAAAVKAVRDVDPGRFQENGTR